MEDRSYWRGVYDFTYLLCGEWVPAVLAALSERPMDRVQLVVAIRALDRGRLGPKREPDELVLARTLQRMERDGLVVRAGANSYTLSGTARSLGKALAPLTWWADDHADFISRVRESRVQ